MFFAAATMSVVAVFIFSGARANAYVVGTGTTMITPNGTNYNVASSLQNLFSPFSGFIKNLQLSNKTTINIHATSATWPTVDLTPQVKSFLTPWLTKFDDWFYGLTKIRLSGIVFVGLNAITWTLGLAGKVVNWLLDLFR
jgi:hypothetical protein